MTYNLKYALEKEDYVMFQLMGASTSEIIKKKRKNSRMIVPIVYVIMSGVIYLFTDLILIVIAFMIFAVIWYLYYPTYEGKKYRKSYNDLVDENFKSHFGTETITKLSDDEISSENVLGNTTVKVENITQIVETNKYIFICMASAIGLIFPKHAIENMHELEQWISKIVEKHNIPKRIDLDWAWK